MISSELIFAPFLLIVLLNAFHRDKGQHRAIKVFHAGFLAFIVLWHCRVYRILGWSLIHPARAYEKIVEISGIFPIWFYVPFWIVSSVGYAYGVLLGFSAAKRNPKSVRRLIIFIPVLWILDSIEMFREDAMNWGQFGSISPGIILIFAMLFMSIPYVPTFFFYRHQKVRQALFESSATQAAKVQLSPEEAC